MFWVIVHNVESSITALVILSERRLIYIWLFLCNDGCNNPRHRTTWMFLIILFDIMDTVVCDSFYHDVPLPSSECLLKNKSNASTWLRERFDKGVSDEVELARTFFNDGRPLDLEGCFLLLPSHVSGHFCMSNTASLVSFYFILSC